MVLETNRLSKVIRLAAMGAGLCLGLGSMAGSLLAQQQPEEDAGQEGPAAELGDVEVTGSRIRRPEFTSPAPVTTITSEQIQESGLVTLGDLLAELPQLSSTFTLQNSARFIGTAGGGFLDLRGLGTDRTLVLINGKRHVAGSVGDASVDINSIPTDLIERIEVSTGAQSAVNGADAVAGTVNVILRDNFDGVRTRASIGFADRASDDFHRYSAAITAGRDFIGGRGNAVISIGWDRQNQLTAGEAGGRFAEQFGFITNPEDGDFIDPDTGFQIDDGVPDDIFVDNFGIWFISEGGTFFDAIGGVRQFNPDGSIRTQDLGSFEFFEAAGNCGGENCRALDLTTFTPLQVGFERVTADSLMSFEFNDNIEGYLEVRYANVDARQQGQPSFDNVPQAPIAIDNAFLSEDARNLMLEQGLSQIGVRRFNTDLGLRREFDNRETVRAVGGLRGSFEAFGRTLDYDAFANYGRTTVERVNENNRIDERWFAAIDAVEVGEDDIANITDPGIFPEGVSAGDIVCRSTLLAAQGETPVLANGDVAPEFAFQGCVPANILGSGNISDEAIAFVNSTAVATGEIEQFQTGGFLAANDLFDPWGAGSIAAVLGFEFRREDAKAREDSLSALGNTFFNALGAVDGDFSVTEGFAEVQIPLLRDLPFFRQLTLEGAGRLSDYSSIGSTETWEGRLNWQPFEQLTFRGTIGEAIRAPTISDLFGPESENFVNINDPCDQENLDQGRTGRNTRIENCMALGIADPENFDSADEQSRPAVSAGNPNIGEETSDVYTIGVVWSPSFISNLDLSVDFWDIEITDAISMPGAQTIADRCVDDPSGINNQFCDLIDRGPDGNVVELRQFPVNLNEFKTQGVDISTNYVYNAGNFGTFRLRGNAQYLDQRKFLLNTDDDIDLDAGELGDPDWEASFNLNWNRGNLGAFGQLRVIDEQLIFDQTTLGGGPNNPDANPDIADITKVDAELFVDLGVSYQFPMGFTTQVSVDNVFDNVCPKVLGTCGGENSAIFDNVGRFFNFEAAWNF